MSEEIKTTDDLLNEIYNDLAGTEEHTEEETNSAGSSEEEGGAEEQSEEPSTAESEGSESAESVEETVAEDDDNLFEDWDTEESPASEQKEGEQKSEPDYSEIGKALGLENVGKDDLLKAIKQVKESADVLGKLPDDLGAAVKLALEGKDYSAIFKQDTKAFDHSLYDDETLLKHEYANLFKDGEGNIDMQELNDYIESLDPVQKKIEAKRIRQSIDALTEQQKQQEEYQREQEYLRREQDLRHTLDTKNDIKGFKLTPDTKKTIYEKIATGEAVKDMFYNDKGEYDMSKVVEAYFIYQNFDKIKRFLISKARNETKREDFNSISNSQVNKPAGHTEASPKEQTGVDLMLEELMKRNGLT